MLVLIEGNIAAGKTTLGKKLAASDQFSFIPEPVDRWQTGFAANLLERFYTETRRWAFTLQICAFVTRAQAIQNLPDDTLHVAFERSVFCDRHVFAKNVYQQGLMDETEWALYLHFWDFMAGQVPVPDAIIYLRTSADECFHRLQQRGRSEEQTVTLEYLQQLEDRHDEWLLGNGAAEAPVIVLDGITDTITAATIQHQLELLVPHGTRSSAKDKT
ncbi:MAG: deoxynucleoside kinase [Anaerolineae bacterium]|nr:deoxynucleoside kinase [Anaerolineae bacterium]